MELLVARATRAGAMPTWPTVQRGDLSATTGAGEGQGNSGCARHANTDGGPDTGAASCAGWEGEAEPTDRFWPMPPELCECPPAQRRDRL